MMEWKQIVFGKLIQYPEGPIVQGFEHECTGRSQSVPSDITPLLSPSRLGPGISDLTNWSLYPWIDIGGLSIEHVMSDNEPWLIVCRARGRSEQGEGKAGRWYTQAHYLMIRAMDFSPVSLLSVFEHVRAKPMLKRDFSLPCVLTQESPKCLREGWIDYIAPVIRYLMSGIPFVISSSKVSMESMEELAHLLYMALPRAISWKLTIKLGADVFSEGDAAFGVAHKVMSGPRMIGFSLGETDHQIRSVDKAQNHPIQTDRLLGDRYVEFLHAKARACTTDQELQETLNRAFPHMTWDYFSFETTFAEAGLLIMRDIFERDLLDAFEDEKSNIPAPIHFQVYQKEAVRAALPHYLSRTASFMAQTITLWPHVWKNISISEFPSLPLFILGHRWTVSLLISHPVLPDDVLSHVEDVFIGQLEQYDLLMLCMKIFEQWDQIPNWVQRMFVKHEHTLFWRMVHWAHTNSRFDDLLCCSRLPCGDFLTRCVQGKTIHKEEMQMLFSHADNSEDVNWLYMQLLSSDTHNGCMLLHWSSSTLPIHDLFSPVGMNGWSDRKSFAKAVLQEPNRHSVFSDRLLLGESILGDGQLKDRIITQLSSRLDPVLGCLLWGMDTNGSESDASFVHEFIPFLFSAGHMEQICHHLENHHDASIRSSARGVFVDVLAVDENLKVEIPSLYIVHQLLHGHAEPSVPHVRAERLAFFLEGLPQREWGPQLTSLRSLQHLIRTDRKINILRTELLEDVLKQDKDSWSHLLRQYSHNAEPLWRIVSVFFAPQNQPTVLTQEEENIVQQCSDYTKLHLFCSGMVFDASISLLDTHLDRTKLLHGLWVSMYSPRSKIQLSLVRYSLSLLREEEYLQLKNKYSKMGVWDIFVRWMQSFQAYDVPESFPSNWTLVEFCGAILERMPQSMYSQVFTSS